MIDRKDVMQYIQQNKDNDSVIRSAFTLMLFKHRFDETIIDEEEYKNKETLTTESEFLMENCYDELILYIISNLLRENHRLLDELEQRIQIDMMCDVPATIKIKEVN